MSARPYDSDRVGPGQGGSESANAGNNTLRWVHIIDDDPALGNALAAGLKAHGYQTTFSCNADTAWTEARDKLPDLILCDINMPGKNGYRFLEEIRNDAELSDCPFVFMTGNPAFARSREAMDRGADDFLLKPFTLEQLVSCVSARLRRSEITGRREHAMLQELRNSLHRGLSHEFFTPLTGILGFAEMLEQESGTMKPHELRDGLHNILQSGRRLHRTLRNYLYALDRLQPDSLAPFPVLSPTTIVQLVHQGAYQAADRHERRPDLTFEVTGATVQMSAQELPLLVEELVENAFSFSKPGTPVRVRAQRNGNAWELTVQDSGRGMSRPQLKSIGLFRQFEHSKYHQQGLGVGLFIVRQILRRSRGELQIESTPGAGTTCRVTLPAGNPVRQGR